MSERKQPLSAPARRLRLLATVAVGAVTIFGATADTPEAFAAACASVNAKPTQSNGAVVTRATLCLINAERGKQGLRALRLNSRLSKAARGHSRDMVRRRYFSHTTPDGSSFVKRIRGSGYLRASHRWAVGENIAWGSRGRDSAAKIVRAWMNSPPHREEILRPSFRDAGVGIVVGVPSSAPPAGATYTVDFGVER
jgi:uncharacterized protein YkwD